MDKIPGGYYLSARQKFNSNIYRQPPYMREIWDYLCGKANHKTIIRHGNKIDRGQIFTTFKEICDDLAWFVGYRKEKYKKWQCEKTMKWLTRVSMIATTRATRGILITIINYDFYQNPKNYESNTESNKRATREQQTTDSINKNDKNIKNDKKEIKLHSCENRRQLVLENPDIDICEKFLAYIRNHHPNKVSSLLGKDRKKQEWELFET